MPATRSAIVGSSTVYPFTTAVAEQFGKANAVKVTVGIVRHRRRLQAVLRRRDRHLRRLAPDQAEEVAACKANGVEFIELPVALDGIAVVVNPKNDWVDAMTVAELKMIWEPDAQGQVMNWHQVRDSFPDKPLTLYGAGVDSGTYDYFTAAIIGKEQFEPRRLTRPPRTTTCSSRASPATSARSAFSDWLTFRRTRTS